MLQFDTHFTIRESHNFYVFLIFKICQSENSYHDFLYIDYHDLFCFRNISFTLRRCGSGSDFRTAGTGELSTAVSSLLGSKIAKVNRFKMVVSRTKWLYNYASWFSDVQELLKFFFWHLSRTTALSAILVRHLIHFHL